ncbi:MAG: hypothetical protein HY053_06710 [Proteobacteria bacterium]|nr:hypothetical protein [Pseudomonadota bacterium]
MSDIAFITGADANYYPLLREWLHSMRRCPQSAAYDICILDAGLTPDQVRELTPLVTRIVNPDWPAPLPTSRVRGKEYLKACVCRPFIPKIFPGYQAYVWMDADTWMQNWEAFSLFLRSVKEKPDRIAVTGADRAYPRSVLRVKWFFRWPISARSFYLNNAQLAFGFDIAKKLISHHTISAGCFALAADAPHWKRWQELVVQAMTQGRVFTAEQIALGVLVHLEKYKAEILPSYTHWLGGNKPLWDEERQQFVEPYLPYATIGVMHLAGVNAMRADRRVKEPYETLQGNVIQNNVRYPHYDGGAIVDGAPKRA